MWHIGLLLFEDVELLDFSGPYEVFSLAARRIQPVPFQVFTLAQTRLVRSAGGMVVQADYLLHEAPAMEILIVPGGKGTRGMLHQATFIQWIQTKAADVELLCSVCTGALLLAKAGLVEGLSLTTHHAALEELRLLAPHNPILAEQRVVDNGRIILSAGIAAGIDMAFHLVARLCSLEQAKAIAKHMEYQPVWMRGPA